jgi:D-alanyl-D-alanine carboxypeptidase
MTARIVLTAAALVMLTGGCARNADAPAAPPSARAQDDVVAKAQRLVDDVVAAQPTVPGVVAHIEAPGVSATVTSGAPALPRQGTLPRDAVFRYASNTKTYVAAAVMRLFEQHRLALSDPAARRLPRRLARLIPRSITVDMLLHHTSGLYDFATDPDYQATVLANPQRRWTRLEQVRLALRHRPYGRPGTVFAYSDTGYVLLGAIIERATGAPLAAALPRLLRFPRLGLRSTRIEGGPPQPADLAARQHQYYGTTDLTAANPSFDLYGGGGLIGTAGDLARFWRALFAGRVIRPTSLAQMERIPLPARKQDAGAGLDRTTLDGRTAWFHAGFWGTLAVQVPSLRATVTVSIGQAQAGRALFRLAGALVEAI